MDMEKVLLPSLNTRPFPPPPPPRGEKSGSTAQHSNNGTFQRNENELVKSWI